MSALPQTSTAPLPAATGWIDLEEAARRSGRTAGHLGNVCRKTYAAQNLAKLAPPPPGKGDGNDIWYVHETADAAFARVKSIEQLNQEFDRRLLTQKQRDRLKLKEYVVEQWILARAAAIAGGRNVRREAMPAFLERMAMENIKASPASVFAWHTAFVRDGVAGLVEEHWLRPRATSNGGDDAYADFYRELEKWYLAPQRRSPQLSFDRARDEAEIRGWAVPTVRSARRHIKRIPIDTRELYRGGEQARKKVASYISCDYSALNSNDGWCGDHHLFDVKIVDPDDPQKHVRPWLTAFIDMRSRYFVGWRIFAGDPNQDTILDALFDGGDQHGFPLHVLIDNGKDFDARALQGITKRERLAGKRKEPRGIMDLGVFGELGIKVHHAAPHHPQRKLIERAFRTVCERFSKLWDTYCGNKPENRPHNHQQQLDAGKAPTLQEFADSFRDWLDSDYHHRAHTGDAMDGKTPAEVFAANLKEKRIIHPSRRELVRFKPTKPLDVTANGVKWNHLTYGKGEPALAAHAGKKTVFARVPAGGGDQLHIYAKDGRFLCIATCNEKLPPLGARPEVLRDALNEQRRERKVSRDYMKIAPHMHETLPDRMVRIAADKRRAQQHKDRFDPPPQPPSKIIQTPLDGQSKEVQKAILRQRMTLKTAAGAEGFSILQASEDLPTPAKPAAQSFSLLSLAGDDDE